MISRETLDALLNASDFAYAVGKSDPTRAPEGFRVLQDFNDETTGFKAVLFESTSPNESGETEHILAFGGTEFLLNNLQDVEADVALGLGQWDDDNSRAVLNALRPVAESGPVYLTGHSLGGALAQYAAYDIKKQSLAQDTGFDLNLSLVTFNALGGIAGLRKLHPDTFDANLLNTEAANLDVAHYFVNGDLVSRLGEGHLGGSTYLLRRVPGASILDPLFRLMSPTLDLESLPYNLVSGHFLGTVEELAVAGAFDRSIPVAPEYLAISHFQPVASLITNFGNLGSEVDPAEARSRLIAGITGTVQRALAVPADDPIAREGAIALQAVLDNIRDSLGNAAELAGVALHFSRLYNFLASVDWVALAHTDAASSLLAEVSVDNLMAAILQDAFNSDTGKLADYGVDALTEAVLMHAGSVGVDLGESIPALRQRLRKGFLEGRYFQQTEDGEFNPDIDKVFLIGGPDERPAVFGKFGAEIPVNDGDDIFLGRDEVDAIPGGAGDDFLLGGGADDALQGQGGNDTLYGGEGADTLTGGEGIDDLHGGDGTDTLEGGAGSDTLIGGDGRDTLIGGEGNDLLNGAAPGVDDTVRDGLFGGTGFDTYEVGAGDVIDDSDQQGRIMVEGQPVTAEFTSAVDGYYADRTHGWAAHFVDDDGVGGLNDLRIEGLDLTIRNFTGDMLGISLVDQTDPPVDFVQVVEGREVNDVLFGAAGANTLANGYGGQDDYHGGDGVDEVHGGGGDDLVNAGGGDDRLFGDGGRDVLFGWAGDDRLEGGTGEDVLSGQEGTDILLGGDGTDVLGGGSGDDTLAGGTGDDLLHGDANFDVTLDLDVFNLPDAAFEPDAWGLSFQRDSVGRPVQEVFNNIYGLEDSESAYPGSDLLLGGAGADLIYGGGGGDMLFGEEGTDTLIGEDGDDRLDGGAGADLLIGDSSAQDGSGNDHLSGGSGADVLIGGPGNDVLAGGRDDDDLHGNDGTDTLSGGDGVDHLYGGGGDDDLSGDDTGDRLFGENGQDRLAGGRGDDFLQGGDGADIYDFAAGDGADVVSDGGSSGDDVIRFDQSVRPDSVRTRMEPLALTAGGEVPPASSPEEITISYGLGGDTITLQGYAGPNDDRLPQIQFDDGSVRDLFFHGADADGTPADEFLPGSSGSDRIAGGGGDDVIWGAGRAFAFAFDAADRISGGTGNDTIVAHGAIDGDEGDDDLRGSGTFTGGAGDDLMVSTDTTTYVFAPGHGNDTVRNDGGDDRVEFGAGIDTTAITGQREGDDLVVQTGVQDSLRIEDWYQGKVIGTFAFDGGPAFSAGEFEGLVLNGEAVAPNQPPVVQNALPDLEATEGVQVVYGIPEDTFADANPWDTLDVEVTLADGSPVPGWLQVSATAPWTLRGVPGAEDVGAYAFTATATDTLGASASASFQLTVAAVQPVYGGAGGDVLTGGASNDRIYGLAGNDRLEGRGGNDQLLGGDGSDVLLGGGGDDRYVVAAADSGIDTIGEPDYFVEDPGDDLLAVEDYSPDDIAYLYKAGDYNYYGGAISLRWGANAADGVDVTLTDLERFELGGIEQSLSDVLARVDQPLRDDVVYSPGQRNADGGLVVSAPWSFMGGFVFGSDAPDQLTGQAGDDILMGFAGADQLAGNLGSDYLNGGEGDDVYAFQSGDGSDRIYDPGGSDEILFGAGITAADVSAGVDGSDLLLSVGPDDSVRLLGWYGEPASRVESLRFDDGSSLALADLAPPGPGGSGGAPAPLPGQVALEDAPFTFTVPADAFPDPGAGGSMEYGATLADGGDLPDWLAFDASTLSFSGTPGNGDVGDLSVRLLAGGADGTMIESGFSLQVLNVNDAPVAGLALEDRTTPEDQPFRLRVPAGAFYDVDAGDTLSLSFASTDGSPLPAWLSFDSDTSTLAGTPDNDAVGTWGVRLTAADTAGATAASDFAVIVSNVNDAPLPGAPLPDQSTTAGETFSWQLPGDAFTDVDAGDSLAFDVERADGSVLPAWLAFDAQAQTLAGTPGADDVGVLDLTVIAQDVAGASASSGFALTVSDANHAPVPGAPLVDQSASAGEAFSYQLPDDAFTDEDPGDSLAFDVAQADGSALPAWLTFDAQTWTLAGTPGVDDAGALDLTVTAQDTAGATATSALQLSVSARPTPTIAGTSGDDVLEGTDGADVMSGGEGDDRLRGRAGDDQLWGGAGDDILRGGGGDDWLEGGPGHDRLVGGPGTDTYFMQRGGGFDAVREWGAPDDRLVFGADIAPDQLWFSRSGRALRVDIIGTGDGVRVPGLFWFGGSKLSAYQTADGSILARAQVQQLVDAMAAFDPPAPGELTLPDPLREELEPVIAAAWQAPAG